MAEIARGLKREIAKFIERKAAEKREALIEQVARIKKSLASVDELGQRQPFTVSVVVPTFLRDPRQLTGYRFEVIRNELIELARLLRTGAVDEMIIVDGSTKASGGIDESLMRRIVSAMNRSHSVFHDEVDLVQKYRSMKEKAALGGVRFRCQNHSPA